MSERHYADWCKVKLGLSKEFEEGFNKGYEYAKQTINSIKPTSLDPLDSVLGPRYNKGDVAI